MGLANTTITAGGVAQTLLPVRTSRTALIITPLDEDCWVNFSATAAVNSGELIYAGSPARFSVQNFPEIGGSVSIFSATTSSRIQYREA